MTDEIWKQSDRFELYEVSSLGRVRRLVGRTSGKAGHILKAAWLPSGYYHHGLCTGAGKSVTIRLNRLVCEVFHGPSPSPDHHAAHRDGNRANNSAENLYWATRIENEADKDRLDGRPIGSRHPLAKLTEATAREIKLRRQQGASYRELARDYGVTTGLIGHVLCGRNWTHVEV